MTETRLSSGSRRFGLFLSQFFNFEIEERKTSDAKSNCSDGLDSGVRVAGIGAMQKIQFTLWRGALLGGVLLVGCAGGTVDESQSDVENSSDGLGFEAFKAQVPKETFEGGAYVVEGDLRIRSEDALRGYWQSRVQNSGALTVNTVKGVDDRWSDTQKLALTYCISNSFPASYKTQVVEAMRQASDLGWEKRGNVNFTYVPTEDANCTASNTKVVFPVLYVFKQPYYAAAFFPSDIKADRVLNIDASAFVSSKVPYPLKNILGHELGHVLGFRHEHVNQRTGYEFEDYNWRSLTTYDSASIMHYVGATYGSTGTLDFTARDTEGVARMYGPAPGTAAPSGSAPKPWGNVSTTSSYSYSTATGLQQLESFVVAGGTQLTVVMAGLGNADLYVRFDAAPTLSAWNCRPAAVTSSETCALEVPAGAKKAYLALLPKAAATVSITKTYTTGVLNHFHAEADLPKSPNIVQVGSFNVVRGTPFKVKTNSLFAVVHLAATAPTATTPYHFCHHEGDCWFVVPQDWTKVYVAVSTPNLAVSPATIDIDYVTP